jgi:hypothetical protein
MAGKKQAKIMNTKDTPILHSTASKTSICKACGRPFAQFWDKTHKRYSNWTICEDCRALAKKEEVTYTLNYTPHEYQKKVHDSDARFKVLAWGIRGGKD